MGSKVSGDFTLLRGRDFLRLAESGSRMIPPLIAIASLTRGLSATPWACCDLFRTGGADTRQTLGADLARGPRASAWTDDVQRRLSQCITDVPPSCRPLLQEVDAPVERIWDSELEGYGVEVLSDCFPGCGIRLNHVGSRQTAWYVLLFSHKTVNMNFVRHS